MKTGRTVLLAVVVTLLVIVLLGATFIFSGAYDVSASSGHSGLVAGTLHELTERSVESHARSVPAPPVLDSVARVEGIEHFHYMCVTCHGGPGVPRSEIGEGLSPEAPDLADAAREFSEQELFWIVKNGVKFTGMPAFQKSHPDEQIWAIVQFVKRLDGMTAAEYEAIFRTIMKEREVSPPTHHHAPGTPPHAD